MGIVPDSLDGAVVTNDYPLFTIDESELIVIFSVGYVGQTASWSFATSSEGTTNRVRLQERQFLALKSPSRR